MTADIYNPALRRPMPEACEVKVRLGNKYRLISKNPDPSWGAAQVGECLPPMPEALNPTPRNKSRTKIPEMIDKLCLGASVFGLFVFYCFVLQVCELVLDTELRAYL